MLVKYSGKQAVSGRRNLKRSESISSAGFEVKKIFKPTVYCTKKGEVSLFNRSIQNKSLEIDDFIGTMTQKRSVGLYSFDEIKRNAFFLKKIENILIETIMLKKTDEDEALFFLTKQIDEFIFRKKYDLIDIAFKLIITQYNALILNDITMSYGILSLTKGCKKYLKLWKVYCEKFVEFLRLQYGEQQIKNFLAGL